MQNLGKRPAKTSAMSEEEKQKRSLRARHRFKVIVRLIMANLSWLQEIEDDRLGDNVRKNIAVLTRKKGHQGLLTIREKVLLNKPQEERTDEDKKHLGKILGNLPCFRMFPAEVKKELPGIMYFCYFGPNRVIVKQNYEPMNMYVILSGEVVVSQTHYNRLLKEFVTKDIMVMSTGSYFGEVALLHGTSRTATVTTRTGCEFLYIKREDFQRIVKRTVQDFWNEIESNMAQFTYFNDWDAFQKREACILAKKRYIETNQVVLGGNIGEHDYAYFIITGQCYVLEHLLIKTTMKKGLPHYQLVPQDVDNEEVPKKPNSVDVTTLTQRKSEEKSKMHFVKICDYSRLACFNIGENMKNRIIVADRLTDLLLLPRYFLLQTGYLTFKAVQSYLERQIPNTQKLFRNLLERKKFLRYQREITLNFTRGHREPKTNTRTCDIPYSIRIQEDLGE